MFGEKAIFGQNELTVDIKGRIYIPTYTQREIGEELVLLYNEDLKLHEIYSSKKLEEKFQELNNLFINAKNKTEKNFYEKRLLELSKSILRSEKVDSTGRFLTGKVFEGKDKLLITGAYDHLILESIKKK